MAKLYRFVGNLSTNDRIDRYQVDEDGKKVLELDGDPVSLTDNQAVLARQHIVLEEVEEGEEARFGPHTHPDESTQSSEAPPNTSPDTPAAASAKPGKPGSSATATQTSAGGGS